MGESPCQDSVRVAKAHDLDISMQRARQITKKDLETFDLVIALDEKNLYDLKVMGATNIKKLGFYGYNNDDVPDPYFFPGYEGFDKVYKMIESCICKLLAEEAR